MAHPYIVHASRLLRHVASVLLLCWVRAMRAAFIAGVVGVAAAEIAAVVLTRHFPPGGLTHLVAVAFGALLAYAVGMTVVADEFVVGTKDAIGLLAGEAEAGARAAALAAEHEVGAGASSLLGWSGLATVAPGLFARIAPRAPAPDVPQVPTTPQERRSGDRPTRETLAELALDRDAPAAPFLPGIGQPVPADQLPRIDWTDESPAVRVSPEAPAIPLAPAQGAAPITQPLIDRAAAAESVTQASPVMPARASDTAISAGAGGPMGAAGLAEPSVWHADPAPSASSSPWHDPLQGADEEEEAGIRPIDAFGAPPPAVPITRPLPQDTRPLDRSATPSAPRGSVWDHISQMLAGRPLEPLPPDEDGPSAAQTNAPDSSPPTE